MVKYTLTICRLFPANCLSVFDHFLGLALKGLIYLYDVYVLECVNPFQVIFVFDIFWYLQGK